MASPVSRIERVRRAWAGVVGLAVVVVAGAAFFLTRTTGFGASPTTVPTFVTQRGALTISVTEPGTIKPQDQVVLKAEVEGQTTLIFLIPEGTRAEEGQLLAELDASQLKDNRVEQQIRVDNAQAEYVRSHENLAVVQNQTEADVSKADLTYRFAQEDIKQYVEGQYPQQLLEANSKITLADEERKRATEKLEWSKRLHEEKYISDTELDADRLAWNQADLSYKLAVASQELLESYTHKRQIDQLNSDADQARLALERARLKARADVVQAEADLKAKEAELKQQQSKLVKLDEQIAKTKIVAPRAGLVVYATSIRAGGGRGGMSQPLEEGQTVRERQELIYLPSTFAVMAELMIHESSLDKVREGQPVYVTVDALPGRQFTGHVKSIAPLPDASSNFLNPDRKVYITRVFLDAASEELRTGMSCRAEILVTQLDDAVYVPIQAVVRVGNEPTVYVRNGRSFDPRVVQVGLDNSTMVHVPSGLDAGELVSLAPPLSAGTALSSGTRMTSTAPAAGAFPARAVAASQPAAPLAGGAPASQPGGDPPGDWRERMRNMTPEERAAARQKMMESMTPEQRQQFEEQRRNRRDRRGGEENDGGRGT